MTEAEYAERMGKKFNFLVRVAALALGIYFFKSGEYLYGGGALFFVILPTIGCFLVVLGAVVGIALVLLAILFGGLKFPG